VLPQQSELSCSCSGDSGQPAGAPRQGAGIVGESLLSKDGLQSVSLAAVEMRRDESVEQLSNSSAG
jgi:hypothetical protein